MRAVVLATALAFGCAPRPTPADLVFVGGPVYTQDASPWAEALAVRGEHIVHVGTRRDAEELIGDATRVIDVDGRLVLPRLGDDELVAIQKAVTGRTLKGVVVPRASTTVEDAVRAHTSGTFVVGAPADLSVLQENILKIAPERIAETKVELSVARGRIDYVATTFAPHAFPAPE